MGTNRLNDDLLHNFKDQKEMIIEQIKIFEPIAESLSKPAAVRLAGQGTLIIIEILCYLLFLSSLFLIPLLVYAFPVKIAEINWASETVKFSEEVNIPLTAIVSGLLVLVALLFLMIGFNMSSIRKKNKILAVAGKNLKTLVGQHLKTKAAIDTIEQRHFMELPVVLPNQRVNEVPNPGYGE